MNSSSLLKKIDDLLDQALPTAGPADSQLTAAMRYSVLQPGKRLRPLLTYAAGETLGCLNQKALDLMACAVELTHAYSLIHDDLPAMDDDDIRRGQPSCHKAFGEAIAILAGDALQTLAFELLSDASQTGLSPDRHLQMIRCLAQATGTRGMAEGQGRDMTQSPQTEPELRELHQLKTGKLIQASIMLPTLALSYSLPPDYHQALQTFGHHFGLAFQIQDDLEDDLSDANLQNPSYPRLLGVEAAKKILQQEIHDCEAALSLIPSAIPLHALIQSILKGLQ